VENLGEYRGFELYGGQTQEPGKDGITYWVAAQISNRQVNDRLFTEAVSITHTAMVVYSNRNPEANIIEYIKDLALNRAIARIDMGIYEKGKDYVQTIFSKDLEQPQENQDISDNEITIQYLRTLFNIRKQNPTKYLLDGTNLDGLCSILGISKQRFLFIAMALKEDGIVDSGKVKEAAVQIGGGYITSRGLRYLTQLEDENQKAKNESNSKGRDEKLMENKVFIIHGHDNEMKPQVQLLLTRANLNDVVLHECPDKGRTVIDKLEQESEGACYAIALLSPDDELADGQYRARQNVILEIGYFLGKLGKEKVRMLKRGDVEIPTDLQGILYETYDDGGAWRIKLLKEMHAVGIDVSVDKVIEKY
jgi:predicted nucleotide-binding protein